VNADYMLRDIIGLILASVFGVWMSSLVVNGIRTGRIQHNGGPSTFRNQRARFIFVAVLFTLFAAMFFYCAFLRAFAIWQRL
jgi:hypothetical protein